MDYNKNKKFFYGTYTMPNPFIYYIGEEHDEGISAQALQRDLNLKSGYKNIPSSLFPKKLPSPIPDEVILLAHSDDSLKTIGGKTPKELAQEFAALYGKNKQELKSIKLVACEAGHGKKPLAYQLVQELNTLGFSNVTVHAATHPQESVGGVVSVITDDKGQKLQNSMRKGQVSAVMYGNVATKESIRYAYLNKRRNYHTPEEKNEFIKLKKPPPGFQKTEITLVREIEELNEPRNTYIANNPCPHLSLDAAAALDYLRTQYRIAVAQKLKTALKSCIDFIEKNPSIQQKEILKYLQNTLPNAKESIRNKIEEAHKNIPSTQEKEISQSVPFQESETPATAASNGVDEDYLDKLLLTEGGLLNRIFYWLDLTETRIFTKYLSQQLHDIKATVLPLKIKINELTQENKVLQEEIDSLKKEISALPEDKKTSPTGNLTSWISNPFVSNNEKHISFKSKRATKEKLLLDKQTLLKSKTDEITSNSELLGEAENKKSRIKDKINEVIKGYIDDKKNLHDDMHKKKIAVMEAIKAYVNKPNEENWKALTTLTTKDEQWKKGFFSKVNATMKQVEVFHEEIEKQESTSLRTH